MKEWTCICGSKVFTFARLETLTADFGKEGAIEGHPHISKGGLGKSSLVCAKCHTRIPDIAASEMLKEII